MVKSKSDTNQLMPLPPLGKDIPLVLNLMSTTWEKHRYLLINKDGAFLQINSLINKVDEKLYNLSLHL